MLEKLHSLGGVDPPDPEWRNTGSVNVPDELEDGLNITSLPSSSLPDRELSSGISSE